MICFQRIEHDQCSCTCDEHSTRYKLVESLCCKLYVLNCDNVVCQLYSKKKKKESERKDQSKFNSTLKGLYTHTHTHTYTHTYTTPLTLYLSLVFEHNVLGIMWDWNYLFFQTVTYASNFPATLIVNSKKESQTRYKCISNIA